MGTLYTNRQLFSDHWLRERLPERPEFQLPSLAFAHFALWVRGLAEQAPTGVSPSAKQTAEEIINPFLVALGYAPSQWQPVSAGLWPADDLVWQRLPLPNGFTQPDLLVGACAWATPLDSMSVAGATDGRHPARRTGTEPPTLRFLRLLSTSDAGWGVLTNGRQWRLYRNGGEAVEAYYEVDLLDLAARRDLDALQYAFLFFAVQAYSPTEAEDQAFVDVALAESHAYAAGIEDDLRARAFDAIAAACQGLAEALAAERGIPTALLARADLQAVYGDALALLYRLLFVLYAESRELLPVRDDRYSVEFSLRAVIARLPEDVSGITSASPMLAGLWGRLARLFRALNGDEPTFAVPAYSGRLFDPAAHPLLARAAIPDIHLARMLVLLGRTRDGRQIDYADLAVRQLGSIYEGLLEHQAIAVATEEMVLARGPKDKVPIIVRRAEVGQRRMLEAYPPGTVYLSNDRGERHAIGTYYTPEPVVRYLVEETLGPLVAGKTASEILQFRVLDHAMGSGHFLVAAVDYLARAALAAQGRSPGSVSRTGSRKSSTSDYHPELHETDVLDLKRRIAEQCIYGVDVNESAVELAKLSLWLATAARDRPLTFLDLHLRPGNSLIGLAPGELETAVPALPSAIPRGGKRPRKGQHAAEVSTLQADLWPNEQFTQDMFRLVGGAQSIDLLPTETVADVQTKAHMLAETRRLGEPYRRAADLFVSTRFGNHLGADVYAAAVRRLLGTGGVQIADATLAPALSAASRVREQHHVFNWELEFPEVFRDAKGRPLLTSGGFDAILGNPPYVSVTTLRTADPEACDYYPQVFTATSKGKFDLYVAFVERALSLLSARGRLAYILPNKWLTTDFGAPLRELLATRGAVSALVDFGAYPVFPGVSNYTCLLFAGRAFHERIAVTRRTQSEGDLALPPAPGPDSPWVRGSVEIKMLGAGAWNLTVGGPQAVLDRWREWPTLRDQGKVFEGVTTGANPVFIVFERSRGDGFVRCYSLALDREVRLDPSLLHPALQGRDIDPYTFDDHGARLLFPYRLSDEGARLMSAQDLEENCPRAWAYLNDETVRGILEDREKGRFKGRPDWYGFGYPRNMLLLPAPKLVLPDVADRGRVAYDATGHYIVDTAYGITLTGVSPYAPHFLAAVLNSPVLAFFLRHRGTDLRGGYFRMKTAYLNPLPLPPIERALPAGERRAQAAWGTDRTLAGIRAREETTRIVGTLAHLADEVLHDVITALAEHVADLAAREQIAWKRFVGTVRSDSPIQASDQRVATLLALDRGRTMASPDPVLDALAQAGAPLTAPALVAIRAAFREMRAALDAAASEREATERLVDRLVYRLYGLEEDDIALVEGRAADTLAGSAANVKVSNVQASESLVASSRSKDATGTDVEGDMRTVAKGGQPEHILACIEQALADPYSTQADVNTAMGFIPTSTTGPHFLSMSWIAGLVDELPQEWLRATASGRQFLAESRSDPNALWRPFMALPAYRRQLEYTLLELVRVNQARSDSLGRQVRQAIDDTFPGFQAREEYLTEALKLRGQPVEVMRTLLHPTAALEPIAPSAIQSWIAAQGLGPARSDLTRAEEIARALANASEEPLRIDAGWVEPAQLLALLLLAAARERGQGAVVQGERSTALSEAVNEFQRMGIDIRLERRGTNRVAALLPAIALHMADSSKLFQMEGSGDSLLRALAEIGLEFAQTYTGLDGRERGELSIEDFATALGNRWAQATGEFVSHSAADEMRPVRSRVTIGSPLPLASDLARLGRKYGFLGEAIRTSEGRGARPGIAVLLSPWLSEQAGSPSDLLAINPHLALLYLIAADTGGHAERLSRRSEMWRLDGQPLVTALDVRLRALGYEVWDERYRGQDDEVRALGSQLVEQGLRSHLLTDTGDSSSPLEAPSTYGYYEALVLLTSVTTSGSPR